MRVTDIPNIAEMSVAEKILLAEDLWESIQPEESDIPVPLSHQKELDSRLRKYHTNPGNLLTLEQLQERIEKRK